jgi:uncharacterized protein (DUF433 family)
MDNPESPRISYRLGVSGHNTPVLRGTGIRVQTIVTCHQDWRMTVDQIAEDYDIGAAQVRDALAFYEAHRAEIDADIEAEAEMEARHSLNSRKDGHA